MYTEYFAILIPIIGAVITFLLYKHKLVWWEMALPIVSTLILVGVFSFIARKSLTNDIEYWNDYVTSVEYYERWDEYIHQTCTRSCCCDSKGENCSTETYDCSYVDTHPEYWVAVTNNGWVEHITKNDFDYWRNRWKNTQFQDMRRDYHSIDGDKYYSNWKTLPDTSFVYTKKKRYDNKTQAAQSVFKYEQITDEDAKLYGLYDYPSKVGFGVDFLLGYEHPTFQPDLQLLNGYHGYKNQIVNWILVYRNKGIDQAYHQESYWGGGNKNEAVLCISIDDNDIIQWAKMFSWSESEDFKYDIADMFQQGDTLYDVLSRDETWEMYNRRIDAQWERKQFSDFEYIQVPLKTSHIMWIFGISLFLTIGTLWYGVANEFEYNDNGDIIDTKWSRWR